jgi:hypothetical protein
VVESDRRVELVEVAVRESGGHPDAPAPGRAGVLVLRASATSTEPLEDGFVFRQGEISDNSGHGLILGDLTGQSGPVSAIVLGNVVSGNLLGIEVQQANSTTKRTATTIRGNEIVDNLDSGIYLRTSFQKPVPGDETLRLVFNDNVIAHNAVVGGCTPMAGDQSAAPVVVEGPVGGTDPTVSIPPGDCHLDNCGPDAEHPEDRLCFWGLGLEEPRVSNQSECNELSDPAITAAGANHHCVWTGATCRVGWDLGGTEVPNACSGENSFHGYVADPIAAPLTQRGLTALQGAMVRARFNLWGNGGELEGFAVDSGFGSHVEVGQSCGLDSGCP